MERSNDAVVENGQGKENNGKGKENIREIRVIRGEEFKIQVRDVIDEKEPFIEEYRKAAHLLEDILEASQKAQTPNDEREENNDAKDKCAGYGVSGQYVEYNNNVIAFCGNRGDGKSSAMMTFIYAAQNPKKVDKGNLWTNESIVRNTEFVDTIYVDPSALDDVHNVLDIVLAQMFRNFRDAYDKGLRQEILGRNGNEKHDLKERDKLLEYFQKAYRSLSLVKNSRDVLKEEFDDEGSLAKLSRLSDSMRLKEDMLRLTKAYLGYMGTGRHGAMIISIDDLDMSFSAAYAMAEEIRKYLILPNVVIIMAVRIEQLHFCVEERNIKQLEQKFKEKENYQMRQEVQEMAERYVSKLIPLTHRVNLTKVQDFQNVRIVYIDKEGNEEKKELFEADSVVQHVLRKIYHKTGMIFRPSSQNHSLILPDNMRGMVSLWVLLERMKNPQTEAEKIKYDENKSQGKERLQEKQDEVRSENIRILFQSYYYEWLANIPVKDAKESEIRQELEKLTDFDVSMNIHKGIGNVLQEIDDCYGKKRNVTPNQTAADVLASQISLGINSLYFVINFMMYLARIHYKYGVWQYLAAISFLYTIKLNTLVMERKEAQDNYGLDYFTGQIIFGYEINNVMPYVAHTEVMRGRFQLSTRKTFNCIAKYVGVSDKYLLPTQDTSWSVPKPEFDTDEQKKKYIMTWILFGLLCNQWSNGVKLPQMVPFHKFIFGIRTMYNYQQISVENYLVRLSMLDSLHEQLNLLSLGIQNAEVQNIINIITGHNQEAICLSQQIVSNMDIMLNLTTYCRADYREDTKDELDRSKKLIEDFFVKVESYVKECVSFSMSRNGIFVDKANNSLCSLRYGEGKNETVDMVDLYAQLIQQGVEELVERIASPHEGSNPLQEFRDILEMKNSLQSMESSYIPYARYLIRESSLQKLQEHLMNMAKNISKYMVLSGNREYLSLEWKERLCKLYEDVLLQVKNNPKGKVTDSLRERYRDAARQFPPKALREGIDSLLEYKDTEIDF